MKEKPERTWLAFVLLLTALVKLVTVLVQHFWK